MQTNIQTMKTILSSFFMLMCMEFGGIVIAQTLIEFDTATWFLPENYQIIEFEGKQALLIENSGDNSIDPYAYVKDYDFTDGTIEFDLFCPQSYPAYIGFLFRLNRHNEEDRYELFYFRPFTTSTGAIQYIPVNNGIAAFQYYTDAVYQASGKIPTSRWVKVRAEIEGPRAVVYVDDTELMTVNNLGRGLSKGSVGVWMDSTTPKCYFANFTITN